MACMANYWARRGWPVTLLTLANDSAKPFFDLDCRIRHVPLGIAGDSPHLVAGLWNNLNRIRVLRQAIRKSDPEVVISFMEQVNVLALLAACGLGVRVVVSERIDPYRFHPGSVWKQLRWLVYSRADCIVVQSRDALAYFLPKFNDRTVVIPNPVVVPPDGQVSDGLVTPGRCLIAVGRLTEQKQFDLLLKAFARLKDRYSEWTLTIVGDGPMRSELESLCDQLGLAGRVMFTGFVTDPYRYLRQASLFVMSSGYEGFPNALCEAMACGLPVISTDCAGGVREIIRDGDNGILVPSGDEDALAAAMARLMGNEAERRRLASRAVEVTERFSLGKVMAMWEEVLAGHPVRHET